MPGRPDLAFLRQVKIFQDISEPHLIALLGQLAERRLRRGEVLFRAGQRGDEMFLIRTGDIVVSSPVQGRVEPCACAGASLARAATLRTASRRGRRRFDSARCARWTRRGKLASLQHSW